MELPRIPGPMEHREGQVLCLSTGSSTGCGHPVDWHVGQGTPAPGCDCCSWRKNAAPRPEPVRNPPAAGYSADEWAAMPRRERRAIMRSER